MNPGLLGPGLALKWLWDPMELYDQQGKPRHRQGEATFSNPEARAEGTRLQAPSPLSSLEFCVLEWPRLSLSLLP